MLLPTEARRLASTAAMGSKWQPIEVGLAASRIATAACADLETVTAFRELL
jgi:hypothetical protein